MTEGQFNNWWQDFRSRFPSKAAWLDKSATDHTLATWFDVLQFTDYEFAISANRAIHRGEYDFPDSWDLIPQTIVDIAERLKVNAIVARSQSNEPVIEGRHCLLCNGTGLVDCWSPQTIIAVRDQHSHARFATVGVACKCNKGDSFSTWTRLRGKKATTEEYPRFDETQWCRNNIGQDREETILNWLESRMPKYDFGEYGA